GDRGASDKPVQVPGRYWPELTPVRATPTTADARWRGWWGPALGGFALGALIGRICTARRPPTQLLPQPGIPSSRLLDLKIEPSRLKRKNISATIAADVKGFYQHIKTGDIFGTHSQNLTFCVNRASRRRAPSETAGHRLQQRSS